MNPRRTTPTTRAQPEPVSTEPVSPQALHFAALQASRAERSGTPVPHDAARVLAQSAAREAMLAETATTATAAGGDDVTPRCRSHGRAIKLDLLGQSMVAMPSAEYERLMRYPSPGGAYCCPARQPSTH